MKVVIQRVTRASVTIDEKLFSKIGAGFLILVGVQCGDTEEDVKWLTDKVCGLRIFDDENHVMNRSITDINGEVLAVSQFTLLARTKKGNRPSYIDAAPHEVSIPLYESFCEQLGEKIGKRVQTGQFGADMKVELLNDGPVTIVIDSQNKF